MRLARARASRAGWRRLCLCALVSVAVSLTACGGTRDDPILQLSSQEALEQGRTLMADSKWGAARRYFVHAFEVEPNSVTGREGLLLAADAYFMDGGGENLIKAEARYRDFVNRFPTSPHAAYAQFQIGLSLSHRIVKPDRDQSVSKQALGALEDVERFYPTSTYAAQAKQEIEEVRGNLAEHDFLIGRFYQRFGLPNSAIERYQYLLESYTEYDQRDKVLFHLCEAYLARKAKGDRGLARDACQRLETEFPESEYVQKIPKRWPAEAEPRTPKGLEHKPDGAAVAPSPAPPTPLPTAAADGL